MALKPPKFVKTVWDLICRLFRILLKLKYRPYTNEFQMSRIIPILIFIIIVPFLLFGIEKGINFELVEEKQFDKEIRGIAFGETEEGKLYPKIVIFKDEIRVFDENFNLWNTLNYSRGGYVAVSKNGRYVGAEIIIQKPATEKGDANVTFAIYDENLKQRGLVQYKVGYDGEGARVSFISEQDGYFVQADPRSVELWFYDIDGNLRKYIDLFKDDVWDIAKSFNGSFSTDGKYFATVAENRYYSGELIKEVYLMLFDKEGNELWHRLLNNDKRAISLTISSNGNFIMANSHYLYDRKGNLIGEYEGQTCKFSKNEKFLVIAEKNIVQLIQPSNGKLLWSKVFPWSVDTREEEWRWIENAGITNNGVVSIVSSLSKRREGGRDRWDTKVEFYNVDGNKVGEKVWSEKRKGKLKIDENGEDFLIWYSNNLQHYKLRRE